MVQIVLGVAVFVLAVAVIGLFAMMGELASRVSDPNQAPGEDGPPRPVDHATIGAEAETWPDEIADLRTAPLATLVVLSTTCATCRRIASGETGPLDVLSPAPAVVVSTPRREAAAELVDGSPVLVGRPYAVDVGGNWLKSNFGVDISPSVLVFEQGRLQSAHTFTSATTLQQLPITNGHKEDVDEARAPVG